MPDILCAMRERLPCFHFMASNMSLTWLFPTPSRCRFPIHIVSIVSIVSPSGPLVPPAGSAAPVLGPLGIPRNFDPRNFDPRNPRPGIHGYRTPHHFGVILHFPILIFPGLTSLGLDFRYIAASRILTRYPRYLERV
jgi:hypothetical protein